MRILMLRMPVHLSPSIPSKLNSREILVHTQMYVHFELGLKRRNLNVKISSPFAQHPMSLFLGHEYPVSFHDVRLGLLYGSGWFLI